jgi:hypothetical protein
MRKLCLIATTVFGLMTIQAQQLPMPSPAAKVQQTVGLTEFTVEYARPSMRGRTIFGDLVAYDQVWRTGANVATKVSFDTDIIFGSTPVGAGSYSLFTIPGKDSWTIILNKETGSWGTNSYQEELDVARVIAKREQHPTTETFEISFEGVSKNGAFLTIKWEQTAVRVPIEVKVDEQAEANIQKAIAEKPEDANVYRNAANYYMQNKIKLDVAETYMAKSLSLNSSSWYSHYLYAQILKENGKTKEAIDAANRSLFMGQQSAAESGKPFVYEKLLTDMITAMGGKVKAPKMPKAKK